MRVAGGDDLAGYTIGAVVGSDSLEHGLISGVNDPIERPMRNRNYGASVNATRRIGNRCNQSGRS